jgi:DNA (cytosine-5)-methyltransferase 1
MAVAVGGARVSSVSARRLLRSIELFSGAGGLALGTHEAGFRHEVLVEWDHDACQTLRRNVERETVPGIGGWQVLEGDIRAIDFHSFEGLDLVAGGAPCQPFSIGGKHRGMDDHRNMIPEFVRAIREARPKAFLLENVRGLARPAFRPYLRYVKLQLEYPDFPPEARERWHSHNRRLELQHHKLPQVYDVYVHMVNAADYGAPQVRNRLVVVGIHRGLRVEYQPPARTHSAKTLIESQTSGEYWNRHRIQPRVLRTRLGQGSISMSSEAWRTVRDAIEGLPSPTHNRERAEPTGHWIQPGARAYVGHSGSDFDRPAKALKAGDHGVPGGENMLRFESGDVRYFTVREAARLQCLPDSWTLEGPWGETMRQLGNAVPVRLAAAFACSIAAILPA